MMNASAAVWGADLTGQGFIQQANPGSAWFTPTVNKPIKLSSLGRQSEICIVIEPNWLGSYGQCNFAFMTNPTYLLDILSKSPHRKTLNALMLDGHVVNYGVGDLKNYTSGYPFALP